MAVSYLCLVCPGSGRKFGTARKVAIKSNNTKHSVDDEKYVQDSVHLHGSIQDYSTVLRYTQKYTQTHKNVFGDQTIAYLSKSSCCDAQLTKSSAINRLKQWWTTEKARVFIFYFSGHGSGKNGGGMCFKDGVLSYKELNDLWKMYSKKTGHFVIDACHSEYIVDAFASNAEKERRFDLYYACKRGQVSADFGLKGGAFTNHLFSKLPESDGVIPWENGHIDRANWMQWYKDGTSSRQTAGHFRFYGNNPFITSDYQKWAKQNGVKMSKENQSALDLYQHVNSVFDKF